MQSEGRAKIISKPHLIVTEHDIAHIQQGQEIPYQSRVSSGVTSIQFKKALLKLEVTPSITPDNKIILNLNINKDQIKPGESLADNIPLIDTRQIKTKIRVKNNQTVLLGGIIEEQEISDKKVVPFLHNIPGVGKLFESTQHSVNKNEVIIFITPKILEL